MTTLNKEAILYWFTGKARINAEHALKLLISSEEQGYWVPKASRTVVASLKKANVARKMVPRTAPHEVYMMLQYGFEYVARCAKVCDSTWSCDLAEAARRYIAAFGPVATLVKQLDAARPIPVITSLGVSPTTTKTLEGMRLNPATVRVCKIEWVRRERRDDTGAVVSTYFVGVLQWPEGTLHGTSRFNETCNNRQCQACGHAIKNPFNWIPMILDGLDGVPRSMWVGKDCAEKLFGIKVTGVLELATDGPHE